MTDSESKLNTELAAMPTSRFAARELSPVPEHVEPSCLVEGTVYFSLNYADNDKLVPVLETVVYVGREPDQNDPKLLFQDIDSYREGVRYGTKTGETYGVFVTRPEREATDIFDFERAVEELMRCSLRRRSLPGE